MLFALFVLQIIYEPYKLSGEFEEAMENIDLLPNIIMNPGFAEQMEKVKAKHTIVYDEDDEESDEEPMEKFKRRVSVFFMGPTIKRM